MGKLTKNDAYEIKMQLRRKQIYIDAADNLLELSEKNRKIARTFSYQAIADRYNVSKSAIQKIADGDNHSDE